MKKEAVSVLKPRKGKSLAKKGTKIAAQKIVELEKETIKSVPGVKKPRGATPNVLRVQNVKIAYDFKHVAPLKAKSVEEKEKSHVSTNVPKVTNKKRKDKLIPEDKMAVVAVQEQREDETSRGRLKKKPKIQAVAESSIVQEPMKKKKRIQPKVATKIEPVDKEPASSKKKQKKVEPNTEMETQTVNSKSSKQSKNLQNGTIESNEIENSGYLKLNEQHILSSIKAIKKLTQKKLASKKSILPTENFPIFLQVSCVKIAKTPRRYLRVLLPHPLISPSDDIAIFVPDLELGRSKDYEKTIEHWDTIFREKGVDCIKQIIPMNQVKTEYSQFEMKRKLAASFDCFLADGKICRHLTHLLGKQFYKRAAPPTPVKLGRNDLKKELNSALHKTSMEVHSYGNTHTVQVGTMSMKSAKLAENVQTMCEALSKQYPGGWSNIREIQIKSSNSQSIPIYLTLVCKNKVKAPVVRPKRPRAYETVEGELTTLTGQATVAVTPEGRIRLTRKKDAEEYEGSDEIKKADEVKVEAKNRKVKVTTEDTKDEDDEDEEEEEEDDDDDDDDDQ